MKKYILLAVLSIGCSENECLSEEHYCPQNFNTTFYVDSSVTDKEIEDLKTWGNEWTEALNGRVTFDFNRNPENVPFRLVDKIDDIHAARTVITYSGFIEINKHNIHRRALVIHELGHWIGLPHTDHSPSIMQENVSNDYVIAQYDIETFNRKYK